MEEKTHARPHLGSLLRVSAGLPQHVPAPHLPVAIVLLCVTVANFPSLLTIEGLRRIALTQRILMWKTMEKRGKLAKAWEEVIYLQMCDQTKKARQRCEMSSD